MENASKALIIAGAILLAILIIGLGVFIYRQAAGVIDTGTMDQLVVSQFNAQFEPYLGNKVSGSNVKQLIKVIESSNRAKEGEDLEVHYTVEDKDENIKVDDDDNDISSGKIYNVTSEKNKAGYITSITITTGTKSSI